MAAIFISYRRDDTLGSTGRMAEKISEAFGPGEVFRDLQTIEPGSDFRESLADALRAARIVIVVIGRSWLHTLRADPAEDYVRIEIETALAYDLPVIPVLVEGARMPKAKHLPESIRALSFRQAHEVSESRWNYDMDRLIDLIARNADLAPPARSSEVQTAADSSPGRVMRAAVLGVPADLLKLVYMPRRLLAIRGTDSDRDLIRAFAFLIVLQPIGAALVLLEWPNRTLQFMVPPLVIVLFGTLALSVPLYFAWWIAGARREYRRVLIILLYQGSFVGFIWQLVSLVMLSAVNLEFPDAIPDLAANLTIDGLNRFRAALKFAPGAGLSVVIAAIVVTVIALVVLIWLAITWGAYRDALRQSRVRSAAALALYLIFCALPASVLLWVASLVSI
jgi:hypothetical protein